mmetsp:Transcript_37787/g.67499  ORF Transcript_37787/g.67499 Transcript_37787/m.67499 type:complete len:95 (+) Transcript_37787:787-1071(+)
MADAKQGRVPTGPKSHQYGTKRPDVVPPAVFCKAGGAGCRLLGDPVGGADTHVLQCQPHKALRTAFVPAGGSAACHASPVSMQLACEATQAPPQ